MTGLALLVEGVVGALLVAVIYFALRLDRRLRTLRDNEAGLRALIAALSESSLRSERSVERLKAAGLEAERSLRGAMEKAQALRDELAFMIERGDVIAGAVERKTAASRHKPAAPAAPAAPAKTAKTAEEDGPDIAAAVGYARAVAQRPAPRSQSERELMEALRTAQTES